MKKSIGAYQLEDRIFLHAKKGTQSVAAFSEPLYELRVGDSLVLIGERIRDCIESYQFGNDRYTRDDWKTVNDPLIKMAAVKNERIFSKNVLKIQVILIDEVIYFCPRNNHGLKEGFKKAEYPNIELDYASATDEDLGRALLTAFELSSII
jgi:hypothetical protein